MADPALQDGGIIGGLVLGIVYAARVVRDERERMQQKRNGGTPQEELVKHAEQIRASFPELAAEAARLRRTLKGLRKDYRRGVAVIVKATRENRALIHDTKNNTVRLLDQQGKHHGGGG